VWLKKPHGGLRNLVSVGSRRRVESTREAAAMRGAARCALRSGMACVFALRALATRVPWAAARAAARMRTRRGRSGVLCAWKCALRPEMLGWRRKVVMCALLARRAHRGRADRGNARVARSAVRAWRRGALPFELAMGSRERRHWGSLPPWESFFLRSVGACARTTNHIPPSVHHTQRSLPRNKHTRITGSAQLQLRATCLATHAPPGGRLTALRIR
jgi:hypothetical protein